MNLLNRSFKAATTIILAAVLFGIGSGEARAAGQGHGGGAGHFAAGGFSRGGWGGCGGWGGRGWNGGWGGGWGWGGFGLGVGLGAGLGWYGYPYYGYPYYPYTYGPYAYPYGYGGPYPPYSTGSSPGPGLPTIPVAPMAGPYATPTGAAMPPPPGPPPVADITLVIHTPGDAVVWINGIKTNQTGPSREFVSSGLDAGRSYTFDLRAQWTTADGKPKDMNRKVHVLAGERSTIDFTSPSP